MRKPRPTDGNDKAIAEAIVRGLELAGFDPNDMRSDDVVTFFATAFLSVLPDLQFRDHLRLANLMRRKLQESVDKRRRQQ